MLQWMLYHSSNSSVQQNAINHLFKLTEASQKDLALLPEARRIQGIVARADFTIAKASISGTKYLLEKLYGYGGLPRKPLQSMLVLHAISGSILILKLLLHWKESLRERTRFRRCFL